MFDGLLSNVQELWRSHAPIQGKIITSVLAVAIIVILHALSIRFARKRLEDASRSYLWRRHITYTASAIALLLIGWIWIETLHSIATALGLIGAALALAMREVIVNIAGWAFIHWRKPFYIGDRIEFQGHSGDVIDIGLFQFTLVEVGNWVDADQSTGRIIHMPNAKVLSEPLVNYTKDFSYIWNELRVLITFESNWQKAKSTLTDIVAETLPDMTEDAQRQIKKAANRYMIFFRKLTPIIYTRVRDCGVELTIRYLTHPRQRRETEHKLWEQILARFAEHDDISFAYPTIRYYQTPMSHQRPPASHE